MEFVSSSPTRPSRPAHPNGKPHSPGKPHVGSTPRTAHKPKGATLKDREAARRALAASAKTRASQRLRLPTVLAPIAAVLAVLAVLITVRATTSQDHAGKKSRTAAAAVLAQVTAVPAAALDAAGAPAKRSATITAIAGAPLTLGGKARVLYVGAEYCPFCAAERWPLIVALARFGSWNGLKYSYSGPAPEVFPDTATFTFHGATFTSRYVSFTGVETATNRQVDGNWQRLDRLAPADSAIMGKYDAQGSIPFTDLGGRWVINGATYDPTAIHGKTHAAIAATLSRPSSAAGRAIDSAANVLTAAICRGTSGQPAAVCTRPGVVAAGKTLP